MSPILSTSLIQHVSTVPDPRIERTKRHQFLDIIGLAICGVICGAEGGVSPGKVSDDQPSL